LIIDKCNFYSTGYAFFNITGNIGDLIIQDNVFKTSLEIDCDIERTLRVRGNDFRQFLFIGSLKFSEKYNVLPFRKVQGYKLAILEGSEDKEYQQVYQGESQSELGDLDTFEDLIRVYQSLHNKYKEIGARESANASYAEMKLIETRRWKYIYQQNKAFESYFRWKLNDFLSYFTDYGTNPAKAVVKSIWVIVLFSLGYLFFPSEWDVTDRNAIIQNVKALKTKKKKRTLIAVIFISFSTFIHILNAVTLSLNAFTTLGFGDIPTNGIARYMCILEGFIGWFLLTIFSVSMISQVLG